METTVNKEYQQLINKLNAVIEAYENSDFTEIGLDTIKEVQEGIKMLGSKPVLPKNIEQFMSITQNMAKTYATKNHDYGNSFEKSLDEFGLIASIVRLGDKMNRIKSLIINNKSYVKDESIIDTLLDMANYAIMTIIWINKKELK